MVLQGFPRILQNFVGLYRGAAALELFRLTVAAQDVGHVWDARLGVGLTCKDGLTDLALASGVISTSIWVIRKYGCFCLTYIQAYRWNWMCFPGASIDGHTLVPKP